MRCILINIMFIFSELAGVREHDLEVTDQARAAEENVSLIWHFIIIIVYGFFD